MDDDVQRDLLRQLKDLKSTSTRFRLGEVTDDSPLSVSLGGSAVPYVGVSSLEVGLRVGDRVGALLFGNDLLVLGRIVAGTPPFVADGPSGSLTTSSTTPVALTSGPSVIVPSSGDWWVRWGGNAQLNADALGQANVAVAVNGSASSGPAFTVGYLTFEGDSVSKEKRLALDEGDVLTLMVSSNGVSSIFAAGTISIQRL